MWPFLNQWQGEGNQHSCHRQISLGSASPEHLEDENVNTIWEDWVWRQGRGRDNKSGTCDMNVAQAIFSAAIFHVVNDMRRRMIIF